MRPRIEGKEQVRLIELVEDIHSNLSPTQLIEMLINTYYESIYPSGEGSENAKIKENQINSGERPR